MILSAIPDVNRQKIKRMQKEIQKQRDKFKVLPPIKTQIVELDFKNDEVIYFNDDVYQLTIAANMSKECSPQSLSFCIRQCTLVFTIQFLVQLFFVWEKLDLKNF